MHTARQPWERLPDEPDAAWHAFVLYRDMGSGSRSQRAVRAALRLEPPRCAAGLADAPVVGRLALGRALQGLRRVHGTRGVPVRRHASILLPLLLVLGGPPAECAARDSAPVVSVRTVPAVSGLTITFDGRRYVTDSSGTRAATAARAPVPLPNCGLGSPCTSGDSMRARSCDSLAGSRSERNPSRRWTPSGASAGSSSMRVAGRSRPPASSGSSCARPRARCAWCAASSGGRAGSSHAASA